jgi:uncharacterized membrane protein YcaP (DUF421 family)
MDSVIRALIVYFVLMVIFRIAGKTSLAEITTFDFLLLLIVGDAVQSALLDQDHSLTASLLVIITLVGAEILMSVLKQKSKLIEKLVDGVPLIVVENGKLIEQRANKVRVDEADVMQAARKQQGLERMDQIKYAVLEVSGGITIIPKESAKS